MRINSRVVGTTFRNNGQGLLPPQWAALKAGDSLELVKDPYGRVAGSEHTDPNAIAVYHSEAGHLGYVPKETAQRIIVDMAGNWAEGRRAEITELTGGTPNRPNQGINIAIHLRGEDPNSTTEYPL